MADCCERCVHFVSDDELGDYCGVSLDEDEMERFLTGSVNQCNYFRLYDEYKMVNKQI